ncbi:hypothetical protein EMIHUDRAFT_208352 [Emiliania huxleyi CCMP1516]|uniref:Uncharacterized protein n=2 Tax=Emiliania huxleyi TaxID=2903 RepID=A0A0D3JAE5_EMIH1|nr:hypothetical protein EMIHUDRAFT_208352 [Emiliania huxleyi CCMP1516]EOD20480.1 hypothetical protein EMIHUDRAFT_208352 [Emiliania huxleyi CCMP1516]|eukprot:XP_005772909.1 hypothetical protein EMIHUDRAFT_208352 [Emiliania huxleyi CCMP1516]
MKSVSLSAGATWYDAFTLNPTPNSGFVASWYIAVPSRGSCDPAEWTDTVSTRSAATTRSSTLLYARPAFLSIPLGSLGTPPEADFEAPSSDDEARGIPLGATRSSVGRVFKISVWQSELELAFHQNTSYFS